VECSGHLKDSGRISELVGEGVPGALPRRERDEDESPSGKARPHFYPLEGPTPRLDGSCWFCIALAQQAAAGARVRRLFLV
jgi:hypothetical protein